MAIAFIQSNHGVASGTSVGVALGSSTSAGNLMLAEISLPVGASVSTVTDNASGRWVQVAYSYCDNGGAEIWMSRGIHSGTPTVTVTFTASTTAGVVVNEWSGASFQAPIDQWSQIYGTGASIVPPTTLTPRTTGELIVAVGSTTGASVGAPTGGWTDVNSGGNAVVAYDILSSSASVVPGVHWPLNSSKDWAAVEASFLSSNLVPTQNPDLQFPETLVQISCTNNYLAPLEGIGVWTDISGAVRHMVLGPLGRQHELDRIQASSGTITVDNRAGGVFNPWNTHSYLYAGGNGLQPMNPVRVVAAWQGAMHHAYYGYVQSVLPTIEDVLNVDVDISCTDILQMLSLKYLAGDNYAQQVIADGGANLQAYYRLGDAIGATGVADFSGNDNTGSLIYGTKLPLFGSTGAFLYDPNTALDLTGGGTTSIGGGGFNTNNYTTSPPAIQDPLVSATQWTVEMWVKFTGGKSLIPVTNTKNMALFQAYAPNTLLPGIFYFGVGVGLDENLNLLPNRVFLTDPGLNIDTGTFTSNSTVIFDGLWHYLAVVQGGGASVAPQVYIDGVIDNGVPRISPVLTMTEPTGFQFGCITGTGGTHGFAGVIQDVAMYSASLSAAQIANHYSIGMWFQQQEYGASVGSAGAGRLNKVLAIAGLPPQTILQVPYAFQTALYEEVNVVTTTSALNYIQTTSETEPGLIFQNQNGYIKAYNREYQYLNPKTVTSQVVLEDSSSGSVFYEGPSLQITGDDLDVWNDIQIQSGRPNSVLQIWGPVQSSLAAQSASVYGGRTLQGLTSLQFLNDSDALAVAQNYGVWYNDPVKRVLQVVLNSTSNGGSAIPSMLGIGIYDRVTVKYQGQTSSSQFSQDSVVEQLTHTIVLDNGPLWSTKFGLSPYEILLNAMILDSSELDGPDVLTL